MSAAPSTAPVPFTVRITSPLGRSGLPGRIRIVARIDTKSDASFPVVRFYVNGSLVATDADGPPYSTEWEDENPFERCRVEVEADNLEGETARDAINLDPLEVLEASGVTSVGVEAVIQDAAGRYVAGLDISQFRLSENGDPQTIDQLTADVPATTFTMLVDSSQSMSRSMGFVRQAATRLADNLREEDRVVVAPFQKGITTVTGPTHDRATIVDAVTAIRSRGGTAIVDALKEVSESIPQADGRNVIVLITDGYDENSQHSFEETLEHLKAGHVTVYVVGIGGVAGVSLQGEQMLRRIAKETGGRAFFPWNAGELSLAHAAIVADVRHQYRLAYTPTNQRQDGTWRAITLTAGNPTYRVQARSGYQALTPPPVRASVEFTAADDEQDHVDLARDDLEVLEDGVLQKVDVFQEAVAPVTVMLALDGSGSMLRSAPVVRNTAAAFVDALQPTDPLGLVVFSDRAALVDDPRTDRRATHEAIESYAPRGGTALYDALTLAMARLRSIEGRRIILVVTDGRDENAASNGPGSEASWEEVVENAKAIDATIYAIGVGARVEESRLRQLAGLTGGEAYFTTDVGMLEAHYHRVVDELHRRYVIAYTSTNPKRDGVWRNVTLRSPSPSVHLRSRGGYYAPSN
jgi:Ca-activated chloride channel family protein